MFPQSKGCALPTPLDLLIPLMEECSPVLGVEVTAALTSHHEETRLFMGAIAAQYVCPRRAGLVQSVHAVPCRRCASPMPPRAFLRHTYAALNYTATMRPHRGPCSHAWCADTGTTRHSMAQRVAHEDMRGVRGGTRNGLGRMTV